MTPFDYFHRHCLAVRAHRLYNAYEAANDLANAVEVIVTLCQR